MDGWKWIRLAWPSGLVIGVTQYVGATDCAPFTHLNVGLDHFGFQCHSEIDVREWAKRIADLGFNHGPVEDVPFGWAGTARDPDKIPVEFFYPKP